MQLLMWAISSTGTEAKAAGSPDVILDILETLMPKARPKTSSTTSRPTTSTERGTSTTVRATSAPEVEITVEEDEPPPISGTTLTNITDQMTSPEVKTIAPKRVDGEGHSRAVFVVPARPPRNNLTRSEGSVRKYDGVEDITDAPVGTHRKPPCPVFSPKRRWRRTDGNGGGLRPDKGYLDDPADSLFATGEDTVNKRVAKRIKSTNAAQAEAIEPLTPPEGIDSTIQSDWELRQWADVARKVDAGHTRVRAKTDNEPSWLPVTKMKLYDQYFTVQLKTLVSAAIDAIADASFHITGSNHVAGETYTAVDDPVRTVDNTKTLALKSPRGHPKFGVGATQGLARAIQFPLITHAAVDHVIDINMRKLNRCHTLAMQALESLGAPIPPPESPRHSRGALMDRVTVGVATAAGLFGLSLFGLGGQTAQLTTQVKGLQSDVHSIRQKTAALLRAEGAMKEYAHKALEGTSHRFGALRKGLLVESTANAACETSRSVQRVMEKVRQGKLPVELFQSKAELISVVEDIKTNFLKPLGLHFILEDEQLLLRSFCEGYLQENIRATALTEGDASTFTKGSLGHPWVDNQGRVLSSMPGGVVAKDEQNKIKLGIDGNTYRKYVSHKVHAKGMRPGFLTKTVDLVAKVQVPVAKSQGQCWEQLKLENKLFSIEGEPYLLEESHTVFRSTDLESRTEYRSIPNSELKFCDSVVGAPLMTCPRERVREWGVCEEELVKGGLVKDCLTKLVRWDNTQPYIQQRGRSLEFVVFVPSHLSLTVTCPHSPRRGWSTSAAKGMLIVVPPPFCTIHVGELSYLAVAAMAKARTHGNFQGDLLNQAVQELANSMDIDWTEVQESLQRLEDAHVTLREVFDDAQLTTTGQAWDYVQSKLWGIIATLLAIGTLTGGGMLSIWVARRYKTLWKGLPARVSQLVSISDNSRVRNDQKTTVEMRDLKRRMECAERCQEKTASEIGLLKDMGASLSANALNQTLTRVCEAPEASLAESQPLVPLNPAMTTTPSSRSVIFPTTTGLMNRSNRR